MPWQELSSMDSRKHFIAYWHTGYWTMTELCAEFGISRKSGYKIISRYRAEGSERVARSDPCAAESPPL